MQDFLASDVLYARGREEINAVLQQEGIDEDVPASFFYPRVPGTEQPDLEWLDETAIQENLAAIAGNTAEPGLHDLAITSVLIDGVDVSPDTPATVAAENPPEVEVTIANEGDTEETDVEIAVAVSGGDEPITAEEVIPRIAPAESRTATIPLEPAPPTGSAVTIEVTLGTRLGEEDTADNEFSYEVTFGRAAPDAASYPSPVADLTSTAGTAALIAGGVAIVALALALFCVLRLRRVRADQRAVIGEGSPQDLVGYARGSKLRSSRLATRVEDVRDQAEATARRLDGAITHSAVIRYDAYNEMTGEQSSSIALLDDHRNGVVLSSILHREQARLYAKPVRSGRSSSTSPQEQAAVDTALGQGSAQPMRIAYLGPAGTFTEDALREAMGDADAEIVPAPNVYDAIRAVDSGSADRALVPFENSIEGAVRSTLDTLAFDTPSVTIVGEHDHPIRHSLIARIQFPLSEITTVLSHPQASAQCARFIRENLPGAEVRAVASTAEGVRRVSERGAVGGARGALRGCAVRLRCSRTESRTAPTT